MITPVTPYASIEEADNYFGSERLDAIEWDEASDSDRVKALTQATRAIDRLSFQGTALQEWQAWPRDLWDGIPDDIKIACCEIALQLLAGVDPDLEEEAIGTVTDAYATVRQTKDSTVRQDHIRAGIPSVEAWKYLLPYLHDPRQIHIRRS